MHRRRSRVNSELLSLRVLRSHLAVLSWGSQMVLDMHETAAALSHHSSASSDDLDPDALRLLLLRTRI